MQEAHQRVHQCVLHVRAELLQVPEGLQRKLAAGGKLRPQALHRRRVVQHARQAHQRQQGVLAWCRKLGVRRPVHRMACCMTFAVRNQRRSAQHGTAHTLQVHLRAAMRRNVHKTEASRLVPGTHLLAMGICHHAVLDRP